MYYHNFYATNPFKPKSVEFDVWSTLDIKKLSVAKIHSHVSFDGLGYPISGGLYDSRLGPLKFTSDPCATCGHNLMKCSGHYGHIELPFPVYNPLFIAIVANILQISCCSCYTIIIPESEKYVLITQLKLVEAGYFVQAMELDQYLEEYSYKQPCQIQKDMIAICKKILPSAASDNLCKNTEQLWKHYIQKIFNFRTMKTCINCKTQLLKFVFKEGRLCTPSMKGDTNKIYLTPLIAKEHLRKLWLNEKEFLKSLIKVLSVTNEEHPTDICFTSAIIVTPSNTRPVQIVNQKQIEHPKSGMYRQILQDSLLIRSILQVIEVEKTNKTVDENIIDLVNASRGQTINEKLNNAWFSLQRNVDALLDANALNGIINQSLGISKIGLKQLIEKKAGILRNNMMGKRVDYFARSVITPDPLLNICEIGVPDTFAKKLTFPVPVTPWNVTDLRKMVLNGPNVYPGANIVEGGDGSITWISGTNEKNRKNLAKTLLTPTLDSSGPKVVHRHLLNNDMLLLNRQPSLHKPSMMAHRARILKGEKTFRLHYANCKAYNADFDGDEMNAHFPQGEIARAEASEIMNVAHQYLVPRDGTPLSGLIQDHIISGFQLSTRDKFFKRWQYHQLVFQALSFLNDDFKLLPPAILKPKQLWTGKQIISTVIINLISKGMVPLNLNSTTKLRYNSWPICNKKYDYMTQKEREDMSEINVIIRKGELLCGVLDKNHIGASHYSLVHSFYELYGGQHSSNLLSAFSKLFTFYLQKNGFTLSVADILVQKKRDNKRKNIMAQVDLAGIVAAKNALDIPLKCDTNEEDLRRLLEIAYKKNSNFSGLIDREFKIILDEYTNEINKVCLPEGLLQLFPNNNLQLMVQSGAKGSIVNTMQISCLLGQIELEGKRPPLMISGKSLPSFRPYDVSPMAGGFIVSRFMTGIKPQEFFFHCMAGREGLIDTAVKTSRSGYLQRCLVKHLEGLIVNYDLTVRDSDNSVIQFLYGEDGLDISKSQLLEAEQLKFFVDNIDSLYDKHNIEILKNKNSKHIIKNRKSEISTWFSKNKFTSVESRRNGAFLYFCRDVADDMPRITLTKAIPGRTLEATQLCHIWQNLLHKNAKRKYSEMFSNCPDPVAAYYSQDRYFGSVLQNQ